MVAPWSAFWNGNIFMSYVPALRPAFDSAVVRMAVSAIGVITALAGVAEVGGIVNGRRPRGASAVPPAPADH